MDGERTTDAPIVVLGVSRSGTTLLRHVLDRHSDVAIPSESYFIPQLWDRHGRRPQVDALLDDLSRLARVREWGVSPDDVRRMLPPEPGFADVVAAVYRSYARARGKLRFGDKTPSYMQELDLLERVFPDALYVHILRDGRDAALSFARMRRRPRFNWARPRTTLAFAWQWRHEVRAARGLGARLGPRRYHELRYEDLSSSPDEELARLCRFLGIEPEPAMLQPALAPEQAGGDHPLLAGPITRGRSDWRETMPGEDLERFEAAAGDLLAALGYERARPQPSAGAQAHALAAGAAFHARRLSWRLAVRVVRRSPAWRLRQAYIRRDAGVAAEAPVR